MKYGVPSTRDERVVETPDVASVIVAVFQLVPVPSLLQSDGCTIQRCTW